ncbi:uncharacterized protein BJ212DRAFT_1304329 [Suillus subaureus]|uniref:Uncharacterized protein n=1 Tax=Suillus subaureus TaxID=48587 RepID=A0A9P7DVZ0_9AGAM|nr:uncharacterized protein BJ212DRAFT_1304329 [Suillus subaureus]KAG1804308.1 hypothetical protein BJ212DRAFT_1304329 [Suillus subaureus]
MGALAFFGPGKFGNIYMSLNNPAVGGYLYFTGKAISVWHAWVEGALDGTWRAVLEMLVFPAFESYRDKFFENWEVDPEWVAQSALKAPTNHCDDIIKQRLQELQKMLGTQGIKIIDDQKESVLGYKQLANLNILQNRNQQPYEVIKHFQEHVPQYDQTVKATEAHALEAEVTQLRGWCFAIAQCQWRFREWDLQHKVALSSRDQPASGYHNFFEALCGEIKTLDTGSESSNFIGSLTFCLSELESECTRLKGAIDVA